MAPTTHHHPGSVVGRHGIFVHPVHDHCDHRDEAMFGVVFCGKHHPASHFTSLSLDLSTRPAGMPWPIYLCFEVDDASPTEWRSLVSSRLVTTVVPQLDASGFFPRPLCIPASEGCVWYTSLISALLLMCYLVVSINVVFFF